MSAKTRWIGLGVGFASVLALVALVVTAWAPSVEAQFSGLDSGSENPLEPDNLIHGFKDFCVGKNKCKGQTCDEVNDKCVGSVTLQPAMGQPLVGLTQKQLDRFKAGKTAFDVDFNASTGLGPVFNQVSCGNCHSNPLGGSGTITVTRFGEITVVGTDLLFDPLSELGGSLLNAQAITPACAETIPVPPTNVAANRLTNSTLGFGLVEAIPQADIEANALNPPPGVSGRTHIVNVLEEPGVTAVGRFGWKDQVATVLSFSADAMVQEMGITNRIVPEDNAPNADLAKLAACDTVADPEDVPNAEGVEFVDTVTDFQRFLAPPPQTPRSGMTGEAIFNSIGCANCHMSGFVAVGDNKTEAAIAGREVEAYSDFLLHDMGGNGDFIEQGGAGLTELRTTPLWGLRVRDPLWHDGRVAGGTFDFRIFNLIDLHNTGGSEAEASGQAFFALPLASQLQVIQFLDSLGRREFDMDGDGDVDAGDVLIIDDCSMNDNVITPDDLCAIADVDQDGDVDQSDLDLLNVVLGTPDDEGDDESGDDESDDQLDDFVVVKQPGGSGVVGMDDHSSGGSSSSNPSGSASTGAARGTQTVIQRGSTSRRGQ